MPPLPVSFDALTISIYLCSMAFSVEAMLRMRSAIVSVVSFYAFGFGLVGTAYTAIRWMS